MKQRRLKYKGETGHNECSFQKKGQKMNYPAASYGVSIVIPAPNQVRDDKTKQALGNLTQRD